MNNNNVIVIVEKLNQVSSLTSEIAKLVKNEATEKAQVTGTNKDTCDKNALNVLVGKPTPTTLTSTIRINFLQNAEKQIFIDDRHRVLDNQALIEIGKRAGYNNLPNAFVSTLAAKLNSSEASLSALPVHTHGVLVSGGANRESAIATICSIIGQMVESFNDSIKRTGHKFGVQYEIC